MPAARLGFKKRKTYLCSQNPPLSNGGVKDNRCMSRDVADLGRAELELRRDRDDDGWNIDGEPLRAALPAISDRPALEEVEAQDGGGGDCGCASNKEHSQPR